ncbi:MAG: ribosome biogenesis GTP-binding protein YihA/YsxC [Crocinitomicaceae bacterium]|nr:YihA family ribosome biogenesis GTP-binding protein [Crocinitomicaceae bacterium]
MVIHTANFVISNTDVKKCPPPNRPEYAFIGRSNVGKSSLINMITNHKNLAKTSGRPGKTQLINHFLINENWFLVDLPGYGYAKIPKSQREKFEKFISEYILTRQNLMNVFVLIDSRHAPQQIDLEFMEWLGENGVPFSLVFTKLDKLRPLEKKKFLPAYEKEMLKIWEVMPPVFVTSSTSGEGKDELLGYIEEINSSF